MLFDIDILTTKECEAIQILNNLIYSVSKG